MDKLDRSAIAVNRARRLAAEHKRVTASGGTGPALAQVDETVEEALSSSAGYADLNDTEVSSDPLELDAALLEREKILGPHAVGPNRAAYKMLRTQILKRMDQMQARTLAVIGATEGVGKTLTAINLAIAISAEKNRSVLLVDFDLRRPSIHQRLGIDPEIGVEECLEQGRSVTEAMVRIDGYQRLTVLLARASIDNSSELLAEQNTAAVVTELRDRDPDRIVIFDLPPLLLVDDALAFSSCIQAALLVVEERRTRRDDVTRSLELLRGIAVVGTVLNNSYIPSPAPY